jgi:prepilin-type processing-associated H-X9-DG protein
MFRSPLDFPGETAALRIAKVTDGTSKTLLIGERPIIEWENSGGDFGWWAAGAGLFWGPPGRGDNVLDSSEGLRPGSPQADTLDDIFHWWSYHPGGAHFVFVDGGARLLSYNIDHNTLLALTSRDGGEAAHIDK